MFLYQCGKYICFEFNKHWLLRENKVFFSGYWHIMSMMIVSFHCSIYFFKTATVSLLHNWLTQTDTNRQSDIYSIYNIFYPPLTCRREERQGARGMDWDVPLDLSHTAGRNLWKVGEFFFSPKTVRFRRHSVNLSYSTKAVEQVKDRSVGKCPSVEYTVETRLIIYGVLPFFPQQIR